MNIGELKKILAEYPDDMEIIKDQYSDYRIVTRANISVFNGVDQDGWVMRSHPTMSEKNKLLEKKYLRLD